MTQFGIWLKELPPIKAALGVILLVFSAGLSLGVGGTAVAQEIYKLPERTMALELAVDSLRIGAEAHYEEARRYFQQDSTATWQLRCMMERISRDEEIDGFTCDPSGR